MGIGGTVTTDQAAAMLRVTDKRVLQLIKAGRLAAWKEKRGEFDPRCKWIIRSQDVLDYDATRKQWAHTLRAWRHAWAVRQIEKRRESARRRRTVERIEGNNRRVFDRTGWTPPRGQ